MYSNFIFYFVIRFTVKNEIGLGYDIYCTDVGYNYFNLFTTIPLRRVKTKGCSINCILLGFK